MHTLRCSRIFLSLCGCWSPPSWTSPIKKLLYNLFTLIVWLIVHVLAVTQILDIIINVENQDEFSENIYITPTIIVSGCKMTSLMIHHKGILSLIEDLQKKPFSTVTKEEARIQRRFNRMIERNAIIYATLIVGCVLWTLVRSFFTDFKDRKLTFRAWLPYDYSEQLAYTLTYSYQVMTAMSTCCMNVGCDTLFSGLLIHIYGQFEILEERLKNVKPDKIDVAKQCAKHHYKIYKYAKRVNQEFGVIMFSQFSVSAFTVCFNFYRMSQITMVPLMVECVLYAVSMLTEILYYCWYSNEVKLKSLEVSNVIFKSDWTSWDTKARKILLTIMNRATKPIEFTSIYMVSLNLDSFMALIYISRKPDKIVVTSIYNLKMFMHTLRCSCIFLSLCGCWSPPSWTSPIKKLLYKLFTIILWLIVHTHVAAQILDIIINVENQEDFSNNIYITPTILVAGCKMTILVIQRKGILSLIDDLQKKPFLTITKEEARIQRKFNRIVERNAVVYLILVLACVVWISLRSFFTDYKDRKLTLRAWLPYDYSGQLSYTFTYVYQVATATFTCFMNVGCDSLFSGLLIHIYGQFEILEERLKNVEQGQFHLAKQCAKHHYKIYKYAKRVNREFSVIMFLQFSVSSFTVCFNFYRMSQVTTVSLMVETVLYAACMLTEILYYCWYSNEVKLKSLELPNVIFRSDWTSWDTKPTKILLTIMNRATKPIEFTSIHLVSLNLDSFMALMKTSYSMFNLLQQTKNP
ncbi:unnamed protein product [Xylocopa violacea]|uniref:Uncharacterized protein n=1 Tax=Xylocopa violacea TaxID=135666 RepID=A0ABP1PFL9_XYLVO